MGRKPKKERGDICIYITDSLCCTAETNNIVQQLYANKNFKQMPCWNPLRSSGVLCTSCSGFCLIPCNKHCIFLHHKLMSFCWLYCMWERGSKFGWVTLSRQQKIYLTLNILKVYTTSDFKYQSLIDSLCLMFSGGQKEWLTVCVDYRESYCLF